MTPLLTAALSQRLLGARLQGGGVLTCSLDLQRSSTAVEINADFWACGGQRYPYLRRCKERTIYYWTGSSFEAVSRYSAALIKLVPTDWGPPTFEIDGIKMLPTARVSPYADAQHKVSLIEPRGKVVLDTCGGLGYFAAWCVHGGAARILSYEKSPDVLWLRTLNPWSPQAAAPLTLAAADVAAAILGLPDRSMDAVLHDPPRFGIAGELYSQAFYDQLARVLKPHGRLFHYTGAPNKIARGRDLQGEVTQRLRRAGFSLEAHGDALLAVRQRRP